MILQVIKVIIKCIIHRGVTCIQNLQCFLQNSPPSPMHHNENDPPAKQTLARQATPHGAHSENGSSVAAAPETPQQRTLAGAPASSFKERVALKMAELERSIQKVVPGHGRNTPGSHSRVARAASGKLTPRSPAAFGGESPSGTRSRISRLSTRSSDTAVQRLAYPAEGVPSMWCIISDLSCSCIPISN